jgi:hypothetical protein
MRHLIINLAPVWTKSGQLAMNYITLGLSEHPDSGDVMPMEDVEEDEEEGNHDEEDEEEVGERLRRGRTEGERRKRRLKVRNISLYGSGQYPLDF